jgi:nitrate/nitrite-specific signal transduction histidine kinase
LVCTCKNNDYESKPEIHDATMSIDSKDDKNSPAWSDRANEFMTVFSKGAQFTEELLNENKKLRYRVTALEEKLSAGGGGGSTDSQLQRKFDELQQRYEELRGKLESTEEENQDFARRYIEIEEENNNLANLYIASYQLHSTLNFREVVQIILEIVINLIGCEAFAIYVYDEQAQTFTPAASEGIDLDQLRSMAPGQDEVAQRMTEPDVFIDSDNFKKSAGENDPLVIIPLRLKEDSVGAISIFEFLEQKEEIADVDRELFTLLAGHAATAIFSSRLYMESERKLNTMQGFIDLLTKK